MAFESGKNWHYVRNGEATGPVSGDELKRLVAERQVSPATLVWSPGLSNWVEAGSYSELFEGLEPAPPPLPMGVMGTAPLQSGAGGAPAAHGMAGAGYAADPAASPSGSSLFGSSSYAGAPGHGGQATAAAYRDASAAMGVRTRYAGFWIRLVAYILDIIILSAIGWVVTTYASGVTAYTRILVGNYLPSSTLAQITANIQQLMINFYQLANVPVPTLSIESINQTAVLAFISQSAIGLVIGLVYFILIPATPIQATIGKLILGLKMRTANLGYVGFFRLIWRSLMTLISTAIIFIGYLMIGWTREKTGLHDILAGTRVIHRRG